jgi:hypothetical protein
LNSLGHNFKGLGDIGLYSAGEVWSRGYEQNFGKFGEINNCDGNFMRTDDGQ